MTSNIPIQKQKLSEPKAEPVPEAPKPIPIWEPKEVTARHIYSVDLANDETDAGLHIDQSGTQVIIGPNKPIQLKGKEQAEFRKALFNAINLIGTPASYEHPVTDDVCVKLDAEARHVRITMKGQGDRNVGVGLAGQLLSWLDRLMDDHSSKNAQYALEYQKAVSGQ